jgi:hypothetical protein
MIDQALALGAIGVPANVPASRYAAALESGAVIRPVKAAALAIPVSDEARRFDSPRDQAGLTLIKRPGKPALLAQIRARGSMIVHWVLAASVTIRPRYWLSFGVRFATPKILAAAADALAAAMRKQR